MRITLLTRVVGLAVLTISASQLSAAKSPAQKKDYFESHSYIAMSEMERSGVPASITLAQAALESGWGEGKLATQANNYFGIKCNGEWKGDTYYIEDDDYEGGKLIKSCFRKYDDVTTSFYNHTDYLQHRGLYDHLFDLERTDYYNWAHGLKKAGYATDATYAEKLIKIIETYGLMSYDVKATAQVQAVTTDYTPVTITTTTQQPMRLSTEENPYAVKKTAEQNRVKRYMIKPTKTFAIRRRG